MAVRAEQSGRQAALAEALVLVARHELGRGGHAVAASAARRARTLADELAIPRARAAARLVQCALAREDGDVDGAVALAREAAEIAGPAGAVVEALIAARAHESIADTPDGGPVAPAVGAEAARLADAVLADLGLTVARPYRVVAASGQERFVADGDADALGFGDRSLAVDAVREVVVRGGETVADVRRRSLLKRLLFLFAGAPGRVFSKEDLVQRVWEVDYHPLRHDAALFTNIMRVRRLLGKDGSELIRVSDDGYRFCPPEDFLFIEERRDG
jgi:hypothetical protein